MNQYILLKRLNRKIFKKKEQWKQRDNHNDMGRYIQELVKTAQAG